MKVADHAPGRLHALLRFFHAELTEERPGRTAQAVQLGSLCLLVVLVSMTLRVPLIAVSLIVLFYGVQSNAFFTRVVSVVFVLTTVLDVGSLFLVLKYSYGYPLVRIAAASVILLLSMYLFRVSKLGIVFFAVALVVIYGQTIPDTLDFPEFALRAVMWAVAAALYPVLLMFIVSGYLFPSRPMTQLQRALERQLADVSARLAWLSAPAASGATPAPAAQTRVEKDALTLEPLDAFAAQDDAAYRAAQPYWKACIATVAYLRDKANRLTDHGASATDAGRTLLRKMHAEVAELSVSVANARPYRGTWTPADAERATASQLGLDSLLRSLQDLACFDLARPAPKAEKESLFVPDALTNPVYMRFAVKVTLATLFCYVLYHGLKWDGIHTSMLTCVIVAYPSSGASFQKMALRFGGALIGAMLALLAAIVVVPRLDSIFGFLLLLAPILFAGAWVATGSERSGYIGTQFMFTFAMATLEDGFGPIYDLTEIRDRVIGILIGIVVSAVIHGLIWPESEAPTLRQKLADALNEVKKLILHSEILSDADRLDYLKQRLACWKGFDTCEQMRERVALELHVKFAARKALLHRSREVLDQCRRIVDDWDMLQNALTGHDGAWSSNPAMQAWRERTADVLGRYAQDLAAGPASASVGRSVVIAPSAHAPSHLAAPAARLARHVLDLPDWTAPAPRTDEPAVQTKHSS